MVDALKESADKESIDIENLENAYDTYSKFLGQFDKNMK